MSDGTDGTIRWAALWHEAAARVGRPQGRWMCEVACGLDGDDFLEVLDQPASERGVAHLDAMFARLATGEPFQYVLGRWGFRRLDLMVDKRVLIPRAETELVVDVALRRARQMTFPIVCADLGTGSGAIGLSLAFELPLEGVTVWMTDQSPDALDVARANAAGVGRCAANVRVVEGSWFDALPPELRGRLAVVVSNPPYVADDDPELEPIVRDWEPTMALSGGVDGLDEIGRIVAEAPEWLRPDGWLVLEIGASQGVAVAKALRACGFADVTISTDLSGRDRVAQGRWPMMGLDGHLGESGRELPEQ